MFSAITSGLARDLSEQLRLVLEPTRASRLRGDYRTGRRINMRKVNQLQEFYAFNSVQK
jgi:AAA ATPase containing von Willebrand factor type A (vWA) domain